MVGGQTGRRRVVAAAVVAGLLAAAGGVAWFQPQKLWIDERINEALPATGAPSSDLRTLSASSFRSLGHATSGRAVILALADGTRYLRLDSLRASNGPDLYVYLSAAPVDAPRDSFDDDFISLGRLRANQGNQNYNIPAGVTLDRYQSVVIWCRRFTYAFGAAALA